MNYLLLTLGHNSSAIFVDNSKDKQEIIGYEQERLSRIKSDSSFPIDAINEIEKNIGFDKMCGCTILISHWFNSTFRGENNHQFSSIIKGESKYMTSLNMSKLRSYNPKEIKCVNSEFTHHDAHAMSAYAFFKYCSPSEVKDYRPCHILVADGFGTDEEVISLYASFRKDAKPELIMRAYGYQFSLGLFYQYATSYCGMKENQDEYKFLGYEPHVDEVLSNSQIFTISGHIEKTVRYFTKSWEQSTSRPTDLPADKVINFESLECTKESWYSKFDEVCEDVFGSEFVKESFNVRCAIAYFIQQTCEKAILTLLDTYCVKNLIVAGGVFYNVKLNNRIVDAMLNSTICIMPLAGDQGAAIGMYEAEDDAPAFSFNTLAWGKRSLNGFEKLSKNIAGVVFRNINMKSAFRNSMLEELANNIAKDIANGALVNLVFGNMEFGPRALCNTSTLFLPTVENVEFNNTMNNRNEVMPCAPVCTMKNSLELFYRTELTRVIGSDRFMICTHVFKKPFSKQYGGVMHKKTLSEIYTGRPQIVRNDSFMHMLLNKVEELTDAKCLVNTSFNVHGNPIVFDTKDIIDNFISQREHAKLGHEPKLYVIKLS